MLISLSLSFNYFCLLRFKNQPVGLSAKCARPGLNSALLAAAARHAHAWGLLGNVVDQDGGFASGYGDGHDEFDSYGNGMVVTG